MPNLDETQRRMANLARTLAAAFSPIVAVNLLIGSGVGVLTQTLGSDAAQAYLVDLANRIDGDDDEDEDLQ